MSIRPAIILIIVIALLLLAGCDQGPIGIKLGPNQTGEEPAMPQPMPIVNETDEEPTAPQEPTQPALNQTIQEPEEPETEPTACYTEQEVNFLDPRGKANSTRKLFYDERELTISMQWFDDLYVRIEDQSDSRVYSTNGGDFTELITMKTPLIMQEPFPLEGGYAIRTMGMSADQHNRYTDIYTITYELHNASLPGCDDTSYSKQPLFTLDCGNNDCVAKQDGELHLEATVSFPEAVKEASLAISIDDSPELPQGKDHTPSTVIRPRDRYASARLPASAFSTGKHEITLIANADGKAYEQEFELVILADDEFGIPETMQASYRSNDDGTGTIKYENISDDGTITIKHNAYTKRYQLPTGACIELLLKTGEKDVTLCYPHRTVTHEYDTPIFKVIGQATPTWSTMDDLVEPECRGTASVNVGEWFEIPYYEYQAALILQDPQLIAFKERQEDDDLDDYTIIYKSYRQGTDSWWPFTITSVQGDTIKLWYEDKTCPGQ